MKYLIVAVVVAAVVAVVVGYLCGVFAGVQIFSTLCLVIITAWYAWNTHKQVEFTQQYLKLFEEDRRRQQIQQLTKDFLYPLLLNLEEDLKKLSENKFIAGIHKKKKEHPEISLNIGDISSLFEYNSYYNPYKFLIPSKIENFREEYLNSIEALRTQIGEVAENIPEKFVEKVSNLINEFKKKNYELSGYGNDKMKDAYYFLKLIIEGGEEIEATENLEKFWELNKEKIKSELFKDEEIKEKIEEIWKKKQAVMEDVKDYREIVKELINEWVKDYGLILHPPSVHSVIRKGL